MVYILGLNQKQINNILESYYNGVKSPVLEKQYNLAKGSVSYIRRKLNMPVYEKFPDELLEKIISEYRNGKLMKQIENEYCISHHTIFRYMDKNNIVFKNQHGRKNHFNQDYFEKIDSEHKAYWLGFIYADGSICNTGSGNTKNNRLAFNISNKDRILLEHFCDDIEYNREKIQVYIPTGTYSTNPMSRLSINSIKLCSDLENLGVMSSKTGKLTNLPNLEKHFVRHFIRGFFDGDGHFTTSTVFEVGFTGDYDFLSAISKTMNRDASTQLKKLYKDYRKDFPIYYLRYCLQSDIPKIYHYFYDNASIFLNRKKNVIDNYMSHLSK